MQVAPGRARRCRVPQELVDMVIDVVAKNADKHTLLCCSLTAKAWVPRSSQHLFRGDIHMTGVAELKGFATTLKSSDRLKRYVRCISIDLSESTMAEEGIMPSIANIVSLLPLLDEVTIIGGTRNVPLYTATTPSTSVVNCPLNTLSLFDTPPSLMDAVLGLFTAVDVLELENWTGRADAPPRCPAPTHNVRELVVLCTLWHEGLTFFPFAELLRTHGISSLVVDFSSLVGYHEAPVTMTTVDDIVRTAGQRMERFEYRSSGGVRVRRSRHGKRILQDLTSAPTHNALADGESRVPALSTCKALRTVVLCITLPDLARRDIRFGAWAEAMAVLASAPAHITRVVLRLALDLASPAEDAAAFLSARIGWSQLEERLGRCRALDAVEITLQDRDGKAARVCPSRDARWREDVWDAIRERVSPRFGALMVFDLQL